MKINFKLKNTLSAAEGGLSKGYFQGYGLIRPQHSLLLRDRDRTVSPVYADYPKIIVIYDHDAELLNFN